MVNNIKTAKKVIRALDHPMRQDIINLLNIKGSMSVTELYVAFRVDQPQMSSQLSILRDVGIVDANRLGKEREYSVNKKAYERYCKLINIF